MAAGSPRVVRFGAFDFDVVSGELRSTDTLVRLEPQPARVLAFLVERGGEVVTREELHRQVWPADTFVDFERGLNYCVAQIRAALGDSAQSPSFIETLPRRGYRFIATVEPEVSAAVTPSAQRKGLGSTGVVLAGLLLAICAAAAALFIRNAGANAQRPKIAVVPFDNETGLPEYDRLAHRLTDAVVARVTSAQPRLGVIGNAAILRQPRDRRDLTAIGATLGVQHVILGQVQQTGSDIRVIAHLIRTSDQTHLWAGRFESRPDKLTDIEAQVVDAVERAVSERVLGGKKTATHGTLPLLTSSSPNPQALTIAVRTDGS